MKHDSGQSVPLLKLEQYLLGELSSAESERIRQLARHDPSLREKIAQLQQSTTSILKQYPPSWMASQIARRAHSRTRRPFPDKTILERVATLFRMPSIALFVTASLLFVAVPLLLKYRPTDDRMKGGGSTINVYRKTTTGHEKLADHATTTQGDVIQLSYIARNRTYGMIFSVDGRGKVTLHYPSSTGDIPFLIQGKEQFLKNSYELDDAPGFERFIFCVSDSLIFVEPILKLARETAHSKNSRDAPLMVPPYIETFSFIIKKQE